VYNLKFGLNARDELPALCHLESGWSKLISKLRDCTTQNLILDDMQGQDSEDGCSHLEMDPPWQLNLQHAWKRNWCFLLGYMSQLALYRGSSNHNLLIHLAQT